MKKNRTNEEAELPSTEPADASGLAARHLDAPAVARARAEAHGLFLFGRTPEEDEIAEMYGWGV